jgi:hypothetical protein
VRKSDVVPVVPVCSDLEPEQLKAAEMRAFMVILKIVVPHCSDTGGVKMSGVPVVPPSL